MKTQRNLAVSAVTNSTVLSSIFLSLVVVFLLSPGILRSGVAQESGEENQEESYQTPFTGKITGSDVNVRGGNGRQFKSFHKLEKGTSVRALEKRGSWIRVEPPSGAGVWMYGKYIEETGENKGKVVGNNVNLRPVPRADDTNKPIDQISSPAEVTILDKKESGEDENGHPWYRIQAPDDLPAWVHADFVAVQDRGETADQETEEAEEKQEDSGEEADAPDDQDEGQDARDGREQQPTISEQQRQYIRQLERIKNRIAKEENKPPLKRNFTSIIQSLETFEKNCEDDRLSSEAANRRKQLISLQKKIEDRKRKLNQELKKLQEERKQQFKRTLDQIIKTESYHFDATGFLKSYGKVPGRPSGFQLKKGGRRLYFVTAEDKDLELKNYHLKYVGIIGRVEETPGGWDADLIRVDRIQIIQ